MPIIEPFTFVVPKHREKRMFFLLLLDHYEKNWVNGINLKNVVECEVSIYPRLQKVSYVRGCITTLKSGVHNGNLSLQPHIGLHYWYDSQNLGLHSWLSQNMGMQCSSAPPLWHTLHLINCRSLIDSLSNKNTFIAFALFLFTDQVLDELAQWSL